MGNVLTMPRNIRRLRNIEEKVYAVSFTIVLRKIAYKLATTVICVTATTAAVNSIAVTTAPVADE